MSKDSNRNELPKLPKYNKKDCGCLTNHDTRFSHPIEYYRELNTLSYHYTPVLYIDPLRKVQKLNVKSGLNSRLYSKDTYVLPTQEFWDDGTAFPLSSKKIKSKKKINK